MYEVQKRDGKIAEFDIAKISSAISKAFDALEKFKKDGTQPPKLTITESVLYLPDTAKEMLEKKKTMGY